MDNLSDDLLNVNLENAGEVHNFNSWMYEEIFPELKGDILEVGSGLGRFSKKIIDDFPNSKIALTEISSNYLKKLKQQFTENNIFFHKLDLNNKEDFNKIGHEKFDSIIALNVLEHVENDEFAINQLYKMLRKNGKLIILVPCHKFLYSIIDEKIGHFRRYTKNELKTKIKKTDFKISNMYYYNAIGILGWFINGKIRKNPEVNTTALSFFDKLVPTIRIFEKLTFKKIGLSIICSLKK